MKKTTEFVRMQYKCERVCKWGVSTRETERISPDNKVCGTIEEENGIIDLRVMIANDASLSYEQERAVKDVLGYAVTRLARLFSDKHGDGVLDTKNLPSDTPRVNSWDKSSNRTLYKWSKHYTEKEPKVTVRHFVSGDGRTESVLSYKKGLMHLHVATQNPDFDVPEDGETEIIGLLSEFGKEVNNITNARIAHWREEERNGRI